MNTYFKTISVILISILFAQCSRENQFLIEKNRVGKISKENKILEIDAIFAKDSIVKRLSEGDLGGRESKFIQDNDEYLIYSKDGKHLLTIVPTKQHDSTSTIKYVEVMDNRFKTEKGLSLISPFKEINTNYIINKVETSLTSATLYIDELNATLALDKNDIGVNTFSNKEITVEQIPDLAKIKYLTVWFD
ncbi:hypothetical protein [Urechidicola croceus]|uniref:Uncharacterized protein n=1 Tax=Urechidicola croceus TaxID=1850246 RepID=A0A1D8P427_9FLAO|nr:hypothetical protein [Urechidicola croceus]AOW19286.1 hypothetical protein LPB138_00675 [Urechidicola croceus]